MEGYFEYRKIDGNFLAYIEWDYYNLPKGVKKGEMVTVKAKVKDVVYCYCSDGRILTKSLTLPQFYLISGQIAMINTEFKKAKYIVDELTQIPF